MFDTQEIKKDFPILNQKVNGHPLCYVDNGATSQKPQSVINAITDYYTNYNSNTHRGVHSLAIKATEKYEETRSSIKKFINAKSEKEIVFTKGTTESLNLLSYSLKDEIKEGDEILISLFEHHTNLVPWQILAKEKGAKLKFINVTDDFELDFEDLEKKLNKNTKILSLTYISNVTGTVNDLKKVSDLLKNFPETIFIVDAAQAVGHINVDVQNLNCDYLAFGAHKMLGPTGVGVLYGKEENLLNLKPFLYGGEMISSVSQTDTSFNELPFKFEAGTPNIAGVIGLNEAIKYIENLGIENIREHEIKLTKYTKEALSKFEKIKVYSPKENYAGAISFTVEGIHPHDISSIFDQDGIAIRSGQHCAEPLMIHFGIPATARISLQIYNDFEDIDRCIKALEKCFKIFA